MAEISAWSTTASNNNSTPPDGFPEGMTPSSVNDSARELMAAIRRWYEDAAWVDLGLSYTRIGGDSFSLVGDYTATHHIGRRVKMYGSSTTYGTISAVTYTAPNTIVEIAEATVPATLSAVALSIISATNSPMPYNVTDYARLSADNTFTGVVTLSGTAADILQLKAGTSDHVYVEFYADSAALTTRSGYFGYPSAGSTTLTYRNEMAGGITLIADAGSISFDTATGSAAMSSTGSWTFSNGTVGGALSYSVTPTFQLGTTTAHAFDLYSNGVTRMTLRSDGAITTQVFTVATLPSAVNGGRAFVSDANATTFASIVAGGGSNRVPVYSDGTNWRIG